MDPQNMAMASAALKNAAAKTKPAQKEKLRMTIKPTDNDRFVVDHDSMGSETGAFQPPMQHSFNDVDELVEHVKKSYGKKAAAKEEKNEPAAEADKEKKDAKAKSAEWAAVKTQVPSHNPAV